jgi:hypothetical protein
LSELSEIKIHKSKPLIEEFIDSFEGKYILYIIFVPFILIILLALIGIYFKGFILIAKILLLLMYLGFILYPFIMLYYYRKNIPNHIKSISNPLILFFEQTSKRHNLDNEYLDKFLKIPIMELEIAIIELKYSKNIVKKRISSLIGSIEKIGILPGAIAMLIAIVKVNNESLSNDMFILAGVYVVFYIFGVHMHANLNKIERYIHLIEYIIKKKSDESI